jgi:DNA primase
MDAVSVLSKHISIKAIMEYYSFADVKEDKGYMRCACKIHGGNNATGFVASEETGLWFCHTGGCGGGDAYTLVQKMEDVSFIVAVKRVASILNVTIDDLQIIERKAEYVAELQKWVRMLKSRKREPLPPFTLNVEVKQVTKLRNFLPETIEYFGMVYVPEMECEKGDGSTYKLHSRLGFPIHNEYGVQVGISLRKIKAEDFPKWSHQPRTIKTGDMLYNYDRVLTSSTIILTEGLLDVWAYHEIGVSAVACYGAHLSDEQYRLLLRTGADIVLSYDGDQAGREATKKAIAMLKKKVNLYVVQFEDGEDPESITREELKRRYESRARV